MLQQPIAAIARASAGNRKRWISIGVNRVSIVAQPPHRYRIVDTEFDVALLAKYAERGDEDLAIVNQAQYFAGDTAELYTVLNRLGIDPEAFTAPWHVDYPL